MAKKASNSMYKVARTMNDILVRDAKLLYKEERPNKRVMRLLVDRFENFYILIIHIVYSSSDLVRKTPLRHLYHPYY
jgi:hypothetical protein